MAFDEWMLRSVLRTPGSFLARLYSWRIGAITFGVNQRQESAVRFHHVGQTPVIRRITGGRAIYHDQSEVTYSLALNNSDQDGRGECFGKAIPEINDRIVQGLSRFLRSMGIESRVVRQSSTQNSRPDFFHKAACFSSSARYELMSGKGKVVASAQRRVGESLLQHGSIKTSGVAFHPALTMSRETCEDDLKPVETRRFAELSESFRSALADVFQIELLAPVQEPLQNDEFQATASRLKEFPLVVREVIAQIPALVSL